MRAYSAVDGSFWGSSTIRALDEDARTAALYLLTCEHGTIAGTFRLPDEYAACDLQWSIERVRAAFEELEHAGFCARCPATAWVWIRNFLKFNGPANPNQVTAARRLAASIPDACSWKADFVAKWGGLLGIEAGPQDTQSKEYRNSSETVSKPFPNGSATISKPEPVQNHVQVQNQNQLTTLSENSSNFSDATFESSKNSKPACKDGEVEDVELHQQAVELLDFLNASLRSHNAGIWFQNLPVNIKPIENALLRGMSVEECRAKIADVEQTWRGTERAKVFLKPSFIFGPIGLAPAAQRKAARRIRIRTEHEVIRLGAVPPVKH